MARNQMEPVVRYLRRLTQGESASVPDQELLARFVNHKDEAAFEFLLWRHAALVMGVCRRILRDAQAAEDAFQATFLVLARKAGSVGQRDLVSHWLYKVALRAALRVKKSGGSLTSLSNLPASVYVSRPRVPSENTGSDSSGASYQEVRQILDEEVNRLPQKYRTSIILCYFQGKTYDEAALHLGCPKGTVSTWLTRAREMLRTRLTRRGLTLSAGALAFGLSQEFVQAGIPATLITTTLKAAIAFATGEAAAGVVTAKVAQITQGVLKTMMLNKINLVAVLLTTLPLAGTVGGVVLHQVLAEKPAVGLTAPVLPESALEKAEAERKAIAAITQHGGVVKRDEASQPTQPVVRLVFPDRNATDAILKQVRELKDLQELVVGGSPITDAGIRDIKGLKGLRLLWLNATKVSDAGLKEMHELENLEVLLLGNTLVSDAGLKELEGLKNIKELYLSATKVSGTGLKHLKSLPNLRKLSLGSSCVTDTGLQGLSELITVQSLDLTGSQVTDTGLEALRKLQEIQTLYLDSTRITDLGLKKLKHLKDLEFLSLYGTKASGDGFKDLHHLDKLATLNLSGSSITDSGLKQVTGLRNLQELYLHGTNITDAGLKEIRELTNLRRLALTGTQVTEAGLKEVAELRKLKNLTISRSQFTEKAIDELQKELPNTTISAR